MSKNIKPAKPYGVDAEVKFKDQHANEVVGTIVDVMADDKDGAKSSYLVVLKAGDDKEPKLVNHSQITGDYVPHDEVSDSATVSFSPEDKAQLIEQTVHLDKTDSWIVVGNNGDVLSMHTDNWENLTNMAAALLGNEGAEAGKNAFAELKKEFDLQTEQLETVKANFIEAADKAEAAEGNLSAAQGRINDLEALLTDYENDKRELGDRLNSALEELAKKTPDAPDESAAKAKK